MFREQVRLELTEIRVDIDFKYGVSRYHWREKSSREELNWLWEQQWGEKLFKKGCEGGSFGVIAGGYVKPVAIIIWNRIWVFSNCLIAIPQLKEISFCAFGLQWVCVFNSWFQGCLVEDEWSKISVTHGACGFEGGRERRLLSTCLLMMGLVKKNT